MQLTSETHDHVRVHLEYLGDDGYGRASHHADLGAPVDEVPLDLKCRVQLLLYGKPMGEKFVAMPMPGETIMEEFTELQNGVVYEVRAFPRNSVAEASGVRHSISLAPPTQVLQEPEPEPEPEPRLRLKVFLGGMVR